MADLNERGRRKKKRTIRPREKEANPILPGKTMVILSKPQSEKQSEVPASSTSGTVASSMPIETNKSTEASVKCQPTVILRSRDHDSVSRGSPPVSRESFDQQNSRSSSPPPSIPTVIPSSPTPNYQIAQSKHTHSSTEGILENKLSVQLQMKTSMKLIDENMQWSENSLEFLLDQTDFYVIGVVGMQGVGKSTIMSLLGTGRLDLSDRSHIFRTQSRDAREVGEHATDGVDVYVTSDRIILLDMQPVLSPSVLERLLESDKRYSSDFGSIIQTAEMLSLQLVSFLFTVCHTVLVVQDWFTDINLLRFLQTAEMLKPSMPSQGSMETQLEDNEDDYFPHIVFVQNKCPESDFTSERMKNMQEILSLIFYKSRLKYKGSVGMDRDNLIPCMCSESVEDDMNLFLLPEKSKNNSRSTDTSFPDYHGHPNMDILAQSLYNQVYSMPRSNLTRVAITEKYWFHYAARSWDGIKKSNLFLEYSRVMP